jgi:hypothetical protein
MTQNETIETLSLVLSKVFPTIHFSIESNPHHIWCDGASVKQVEAIACWFEPGIVYNRMQVESRAVRAGIVIRQQWSNGTTGYYHPECYGAHLGSVTMDLLNSAQAVPLQDVPDMEKCDLIYCGFPITDNRFTKEVDSGR